MTTKPDELFKPLEVPELPQLDPKPAYYKDILIVGGGGKASIGGLLSTPDLALSYLLSARYTIEGAIAIGRLSEVALPAAYLQRHAVEIALKSIIGSAKGTAQDDLLWDMLDKDPNAEAPTFKPPSGHDFGTLVPEAAVALKAISFDDLPDPLVKMCEKLTNLEKRAAASKADATRMRYLSDRGGSDHFPQRQEIPLIEHQNELEQVFEDLAYVHDNLGKPNQNWGTKLAWRGETSLQPLTNRLYRLGRLQ
jgi:hypothetical protein